MNDNVSPWGQTHEERIDELEAYVERLDAQIAALKAERDTLKSDNGEYHGVINDAHRWCDLAGVNGGPLLARLQLVTQHIALLVAQTSELRAERDAAEDRVRVLEAQLSKAHRKIANQRDANRRLTEDAHRRKGKLAALKSAAHIEARNWTLTANRLIAARQSRARLVNAVREQRELLKAARLIRAELRQEVADLTTEADAARAWAAAWRKAATYERATTMWPPNVKHSTQTYRRYGSVARRADRADRARRAAEAMEQTDGEVKA